MTSIRNAARRADEAVVRAHQSVVDWSQRSKGWWIEQCALAFVATGIVRWAFSDIEERSLLELLSIAVFGVFLMMVSRYRPLANASEYLKHQRDFFIWVTALFWVMRCISIWFGNLSVADVALPIVQDVALLSAMYFAACKPPAPPKGRREMKLGLST